MSNTFLGYRPAPGFSRSKERYKMTMMPSKFGKRMFAETGLGSDRIIVLPDWILKKLGKHYKKGRLITPSKYYGNYIQGSNLSGLSGIYGTVTTRYNYKGIVDYAGNFWVYIGGRLPATEGSVITVSEEYLQKYPPDSTVEPAAVTSPVTSIVESPVTTPIEETPVTTDKNNKNKSNRQSGNRSGTYVESEVPYPGLPSSVLQNVQLRENLIRGLPYSEALRWAMASPDISQYGTSSEIAQYIAGVQGLSAPPTTVISAQYTYL